MANQLDLEEQEQLDQLKHFWATWGTLISALLTAALLVLAGWNGYQYWQTRQARQAGALFDSVQAAAASKDLARLEQSFGDMRLKYPETAQTFQAGLLVAKIAEDAGNPKLSKDTLEWLSSHGGEGERAIARLRLASVLIAQKAYDEALVKLSVEMPVQFSAVVADRKGDVLSLMGKPKEAADQYLAAFNAFEPGLEYRRLVEVKLNAMGVRPNIVAMGDSKDNVK